MNLHTIAVFFVQSAVLLTALCIVGYPVARLVERFGGKSPLVVAVPLLGIFPLVQVGWLWSRFTDAGLDAVFPWVVLSFFVIDLVLVARNIKHRRGFSLPIHALAIAAALGVAYLVIYHAFFALDYQTTATLKNYDAPHLAVLAEHLRIDGFAETGNVFGTALGPFAKSDTVGTFMIDALPAILLSRDVWMTTSSTLLVGWILLAMQLQKLFAFGFRIDPKLATAIAIVSAISPLTFYALGNTYMSQLFGGALLLGGLTVLLTFRNTKESMVSSGAQLALVCGGLWHIYPFVNLVVPILGLPIRLAKEKRSEILRTLKVGVLLAIAAFISSCVLSIGRSSDGIAQAANQSSSRAGWDLPLFSPHEVLGFTSNFQYFASGRFVGALVVGVLILVSFVIARKAEAARIATATLLVGFASYGLIFLRSGVSYQQWKWASLISVLMVGAFIVLLIEAVKRFNKTLLVSIGVTSLIGVVFFSNVWRLTSPQFNLNQKEAYISQQTVDLSANNFLASHPALALRVKTWDAMWVTSFLPSVKMHEFNFYGYYPVDRIADKDTWVLERLDDATPDSQLISSHPINDVYRAVIRKPAGSADVQILDTSHDSSSEQVSWKVKVTNTGTKAWVSPADDSSAGMSLIASLVGSTRLINEELAKQPLPQSTVVTPGESFIFEGSSTANTDSKFALQFDVFESGHSYKLWQPSTLIYFTK